MDDVLNLSIYEYNEEEEKNLMRDGMLYYAMVEYCREYHGITLGAYQDQIIKHISSKLNKLSYSNIESNVHVDKLWHLIDKYNTDKKQLIELIVFGACFILGNLQLEERETMNCLVEEELVKYYADTCIEVAFNCLISESITAKIIMMQSLDGNKGEKLNIEKNFIIHEAVRFYTSYINTGALNQPNKMRVNYIRLESKADKSKMSVLLLNEMVQKITTEVAENVSNKKESSKIRKKDLKYLNDKSEIDKLYINAENHLVKMGLRRNNVGFLYRKIAGREDCNYGIDHIQEFNEIDRENIQWLDKVLKQVGILKE